MAVTEYIGPLVGPVFADPAEWTSTRSYEALTIVLNEGNSYTARQDVPIGVALTNTRYWLETGNYNAQVEQYRKSVLRYSAFKPYVTPEEFQEETDTAAIQAAIDYAAENNLVVMLRNSKTYTLTETVTVTDRTVILGNNATLTARGDFSAITIPENGTAYVIIKDLTLVGCMSADQTNNYGIYGSPFYGTFDNLTINGFYDGIHFTKGSATGTLVENLIDHVYIRNAYHIGAFLGENNNNKLTDMSISNMYVQGTSSANTLIYIGSSAGTIISNIHTYGSCEFALSINNSYNTTLSKVYIESWTSRAISTNVQGSVIIDDIHLYGKDNQSAIRLTRSGWTIEDTPHVQLSNIIIPNKFSGNAIQLEGIIANAVNCYSPNGNFSNCIFMANRSIDRNLIPINSTSEFISPSFYKLAVANAATITVDTPDYKFSNMLIQIEAYGGRYVDQSDVHDIVYGLFKWGNTNHSVIALTTSEQFSVDYSLDTDTNKLTITMTPLNNNTLNFIVTLK